MGFAYFGFCRRFLLLLLALVLMIELGAVPSPALAETPVRALTLEDLEAMPPAGMSDEGRQRMFKTIERLRSEKRAGSRASEERLWSTLASPRSGQHTLFDLDHESARLEIAVNGNVRPLVKMLRRRGIELETFAAKHGVLFVRCPSADLPALVKDLSKRSEVRYIRPVLRPMASAGQVLSEGDRAHRADLVRQRLGSDGTGVRVCAISTGIRGAGLSQSSRDLPLELDVCPFESGGLAEGTAMLEIIHDLAPGAQLGYCSGGNRFDTAAAIEYLASDAFGGEGCDVIVDDVFDLFEPYLFDGVAAQAVDAAVAGGAVYLSSAGNNARTHYEAFYRDVRPGDQDGFAQDFHDWGRAAGGPSDFAWEGRVGGTNFAPRNAVLAVLQWDDPVGASANDYDLYLVDQNGFAAGDPRGQFPNGGNGIQRQSGDGFPIERAFIVNETPEALPFFLVIDRFGGKPRFLEIGMNSNFAFTVNTPDNFAVAKGGIVGHAAARGALTVGATGAVVNSGGVPNPGLDIIEPFSSQGPSLIFFDENGRRSFEARAKPDFVAVDGVSVTGNGGFPSVFFGTSAAAPHAAAIAALAIDASGKENLTPKEVALVLKGAAERRGPREVWGLGFLDALRATRIAEVLFGRR